MEKQFIVERQGKSFVLYAGLLAEAHEQGLQSITTELVQIPSEANNRVAICTATVTMAIGDQTKIFTGIADAAPNNVAPAMQSCLIRMSETRAKARALRDAVNVGMAALEELGDEDEHPQPTHNRATRPAQQPKAEAKPNLQVVQSDPQEAARQRAWDAFVKACADAGFVSNDAQLYIEIADELCKNSGMELETDEDIYDFAAGSNALDIECAIHDVKTRKQQNGQKAIAK